MDIEKWLHEFREAWKSKDIESVLELFTEDVKYHETPFQQFDSWEDLREEWKTVKDQENIVLETEVFSRDGDRFTVKWGLSYSSNGERKELKGVYLIKLNQDNKCYEFWQYPVGG